MTTSEALVSRVRELAARCPAGAMQQAAVKLADEYEIAIEQGLRAETTIHEMTKGREE